MGGVGAILRLVPALDLVVAIMASGEGGMPERLADDALASLDERFSSGLREERSRPASAVAREALPIGVWSGTVETSEDRVPIALEIGSESLMRLDGAEGFLENARLSNGRLQGTFEGDLATADLVGKRTRIQIDLTQRGDRLSGAASAITLSSEQRVGDALSFWTELERL